MGTPTGGTAVEDITQPFPGLKEYRRKHWVASNRLLTRHGRIASNMHKWRLKDTPTCPHCKSAPQTTDHLVLHCPVTKFEGGYRAILSGDDAFAPWIDNLKLEV